jgi:hypothetical protein
MVVKLDASYIDEVAKVHELIDPTSCLHQAGYGWHLKKEVLYDSLVRSEDSLCLIYLSQGKVVGYIALTKNANH